MYMIYIRFVRFVSSCCIFCVFFLFRQLPRSGSHQEINRHTTDESLYDSKVRRLADDPRQQGLGPAYLGVLKHKKRSLNCEFNIHESMIYHYVFIMYIMYYGLCEGSLCKAEFKYNECKNSECIYNVCTQNVCILCMYMYMYMY